MKNEKHFIVGKTIIKKEWHLRKASDNDLVWETDWCGKKWSNCYLKSNFLNNNFVEVYNTMVKY